MELLALAVKIISWGPAILLVILAAVVWLVVYVYRRVKGR